MLSLTCLAGSGCAVVDVVDSTPPVMPPRRSTVTQNKPAYKAPEKTQPPVTPTASTSRPVAPVPVVSIASDDVAPTPAPSTVVTPPIKPATVSVAVISPPTQVPPTPTPSPTLDIEPPSKPKNPLAAALQGTGAGTGGQNETGGLYSVEQSAASEDPSLKEPVAQIPSIVLPPIAPAMPEGKPATRPAGELPPAAVDSSPKETGPIQAAPYNPAPQPTVAPAPTPVDPERQKVRDRLALVKSELEKGKDVNEKDDNGRTLLQQAALAGEQATVELLLDWGASVKAVDRQGWTALHWAASSGHQEICELLIACGTPVDSQGFLDETPLYWASVFDRQQTVELLLARGAKVNAADKRGKSPLHAAVEGDARGTAAVLIAHGADVTAKDEAGLTPLHQVVMRLRKTLLGLAEDTEQRTPEPTSSEAAALDREHQRKLAVVAAREMAKLLISKGADVNAATPSGVTPLHLAAWDDTKEIADVLIAAGARSTLKDTRGRTPGEYAKQRGQKQVLAVITDSR